MFKGYARSAGIVRTATFTDLATADEWKREMQQAHFHVVIVTETVVAEGYPEPPAPCGYCRRCAIHDDPGGCLTVEQWERDNPEAAGYWRGVEARRRYDAQVARRHREASAALVRQYAAELTEDEFNAWCEQVGISEMDAHELAFGAAS